MSGPSAELRADTLVWQRDYPDPVEDVWAAVTESQRLGRWIGTWTGEPRPGGTVAFTMTGEVDAGGEVCEPVDVTIVECDAPRRLVVDLPNGDGQDWRIEIDVERRDDGARLVFAQRLVDGVRAEDVEAGWSWYLDRLGASLRGDAMPDWADYAP